MKYILLVVSIVYSLNSFGQDPDPDLFQTWYLTFIQSTDLSDPFTVSEIEPPITPYLIISEDLNFNGEGACNSFNGTFGTAAPINWQTAEFFKTTDDCGIQIHNLFETAYFDFLSCCGWYEINPVANGLQLIMYSALFGEAIFYNFILNTTDLNFSSIKAYPNPSNSMIYIEAGATIIMNVEFFNSYGQRVKAVIDDLEEINIADLSSGIYIMRIFTESGSTNRKIIKE